MAGSHSSLPTDALDHERAARKILEIAASTPTGTLLSLEGSWGRGKTDTLLRLREAAAEESSGMPSVWINPWQYQQPDLLTPLVLQLLDLVPETARKSDEALKMAARTVVRGGLSLGFKLTSLMIPGGRVLETIGDTADEVLKGLFDASDAQQSNALSADPGRQLGREFGAIVDRVLEVKRAERMLILVDDIDRCLPSRQIALLEALHFLHAAGARCTAVVAMDPSLLRQSLKAHYGTDAFDHDRYLDKLFYVRMPLPAVRTSDTETLVRTWLADDPMRCSRLMAWLGQESVNRLPQEVAGVLSPLELKNPRLVYSLLSRMYLLAMSESAASTKDGFDPQVTNELRWLLTYVLLAVRWPAVRHALHEEQLSGIHRRFGLIRSWIVSGGSQYVTSGQSRIAAVDVLPHRASEPVLAEILDQFSPADKVQLSRFEAILRRACF